LTVGKDGEVVKEVRQRYSENKRKTSWTMKKMKRRER